MSVIKKHYRKFTESERRSYIREYLSSPDTVYGFELRHGLSRNSLSGWMKKYEIDAPKMKNPVTVPKVSDEESSALIARLRAENAALHKCNRELQRELDTTRMLHEATELMIDLAEETYHIPVRKNSDAR